MKLRVIAVASWILAIGFTVFVAPSFQPIEYRDLIANHGSITIQGVVLSDQLGVTGFAGTPLKQVNVRIEEPGWMRGKQGLMQLGEAQLTKGEFFTAVVNFRPSHRRDLDFKSSLKHLISKHKTHSTDIFDLLRTAFATNLTGVSSDSAALVAGLAIGDDGQLSQETKDNFKTVSLTHLTAVSGANCAIVLSVLALLILRIPISRRLRLAMSLGAIVGYLLLVGPQPSVLRASAMVSVVLIGQFFGRKVHPLDAIALSIIGLLLWEPWLSLDYGFILSVLATLGLLVLAPSMADRFATRMPNWLAVMVAVTVSAQVACLPILMVLQPQLPLYSVVANLFAEPLVFPITVLGLVSCLLAFLPWLATPLSYVASIPAAVIIWLAKYLAHAPMASIDWYAGGLGILLAIEVTIATIGFFISRNRKLKALSASSLLLIGLVFASQNSALALSKLNFYSGKYSVVNCDVGQGDALVIRSAGQVALIDVGREDQPIDGCLSSLGISRIDLLVITHFDMDHCGGIQGAIQNRSVGVALTSPFRDQRPGVDFVEATLTDADIEVAKAGKGMSGLLGDFNWLVLSPHLDAAEAEDSNDGSISMMWQDKNLALLTLADLGERGQLRIGQEWGSLLSSGFGGRSVIVKVAHHGSADQAFELYEAIKPQVALISVGEANSYGHPTRRTLSHLEMLNVRIFRTDQQGAIGVAEADSGLTVSVSGRS